MLHCRTTRLSLLVASLLLCAYCHESKGQQWPRQCPPCPPARPYFPQPSFPRAAPYPPPNYAPIVPMPGRPAAPDSDSPTEPDSTDPAARPETEPPSSLADSLPDTTSDAASAAAAAPQRSVGGTAGGFASVANHLGDNFGGGGGCTVSILPVPQMANMFSATGFIVGGTPPGAANATLVFETTGGPANDFFSQGPGLDTNNDGRVDTFMVAEPTPPTDAPISTEPGAIYLGGTAFNPATTTGEYQDGQVWDINYRFAVPQEIKFSTSGGGALVGRQKIAENNSPIPRDRVFFNYSGFKNVPLTNRGVSVRRFTLGFEKTFLDQQASIEVRVPVASTLSSQMRLSEGFDSSHGELGDVMVALKLLMLTVRSTAFTAGLALTFPTGDDTQVFLTDSWEFVRIQNETFHVMPYVGYTNIARNNRLFFSSFVQLDVDVNGNELLTNFDNTQLRGVGRMQDPILLYADASLGYWLLQPSRRAGCFLQGIAPIVEAHYNSNLSPTDFFRSGNYRIGQPRHDNVETVNAVVGGVVNLRGGTTVSAGYATPVGNHIDSEFDGELRVFANKYY